MNREKQKGNIRENLDQSFRMKTQKALELINRHQEQKYSFFKTRKPNKEYLKYSPQKQSESYQNIIGVQQIYQHQNHKIQLLPFDDLFYKLANPFYSQKSTKNEQQVKVKAHDDKFKNQTVQISFNDLNIQQNSFSNFNQSFRQKHHRVKQMIDCRIKILIKNYRGSATELFFYFQNYSEGQKFSIPYKRFTISNQKIIHINLDDFLNKKWIYIRFKTKEELTMFSIRVENQHSIKKKFYTDASQQDLENIQEIKKLPQLKIKSNSLQSLKSNSFQKAQKIVKKPKSQSLKALSLIELIKSNEFSCSKGKSKEILQKMRKQQIAKKKLQQQKKLQQIIAKKNAVEQARQIELKLKSKALQMKKMIEQYRIIDQDELKKIKLLQPKIAALIFLPQFNKICHEMMLQRQEGMKTAWKTRALTKKFIKIIKRRYRQGIDAVKNKKNRQLLKIRDFTTLFGKILYKNSLNKSFNVVISTVQKCKTGLILNQILDSATQYRRAVRCIQKMWLSQYHAKMEMFQMYAKDQAQKLIEKHSNFKCLHSKFLIENTAHQLAYKYISQESSKIKDLFEEYEQKLKEIEQFQVMNKRIVQFNKTALKKRQKPYLQVPTKPCYPFSRYFRNITFLKSMIRAWFELQYRKWSKINKSSIVSMSQGNKKSISPIKSIRKASINSVDLHSREKNQI